MLVFRHSTAFVRSRWKASVNSMLISRFSSHSSLRKLNRTCFLGVYHIYKTWPVTTKSTIQDQFNGVYNLPLHHLLFNFSGSQPILLIHGSLIIIWKAISSHQIKKMTTEQKNKQKRRKCPKMAFCPRQRDCSTRVCCSLQSHFGIRVSLVQVQIYFCRRSVTIFLTCYIQYLPLYKWNWV